MIDEGDIPHGAIYMGTKEVMEGDQKHTDTFYLLPGEKGRQEQTKVAKVETKDKTYEGIGPTDEQTGIPIVPRGSVAEESHHDWYKQMYASLHRTKKAEEKNTYKPTYTFPEPNKDSAIEDRVMSDRYGTDHHSPKSQKYNSWSPPHAKYRDEKYKVQPNSIVDYEPGRSSIALREARVNHQYNPPVEKPGQYSKYTESARSPGIRKNERPLSPGSDAPTRELYKAVQAGGDIPIEGLRFPQPAPSPKKERTQSAGPTPGFRHSLPDTRSPNATIDRRRRDEEAARRRAEMERITMEEKRKRMLSEMRDNESRRHNDFWMPSEKSPIPLNRYNEEEGPGTSHLTRPSRKPTSIRGKAKAKYNFTAQNPKELSFRKGDTIYLRSEIDKNWYQGERHGRVGLFPRNYVEIITSLDEARATAQEREGSAIAKYNFTAQTSVELSFKKGEMIQLIRRVDDNWFEGRVGNQQGIFPHSYVVVDYEPDTPCQTPMSSYAPTPVPGSPGQLSPTSSIYSNGPAPTIPSAPLSPASSRGGDNPLDQFNFDFNSLNINDLTQNMQNLTQNMQSLTNGLHKNFRNQQQQSSQQPNRGYRSEYTPGSPQKPGYGQPDRPSSAGPYSQPSYSSGDYDPYRSARSRSSLGMYNNEPSQHTSLYEARIKSPTPMDNMSNHGNEGSSSSSLRARSASPYGANKVAAPSRKHTDAVSTGMLGKQSYPLYRSIFAYFPQNNDELELKEGDIVYVMEKCDDGWFVGTSERTKDFGTFPGNYVKPV